MGLEVDDEDGVEWHCKNNRHLQGHRMSIAGGGIRFGRACSFVVGGVGRIDGMVGAVEA